MISDFLYTLNKIIKSRIFLVGLFFTILFGVLISRIFDLQIINENYYMSTYIQQSERKIYTSGTRGKILDAKGKVLAYDTLAYAVTIEDKLDSTDDKNQKLNSIVEKSIDIIEKYGDHVIVDFPIYLDSDGRWTENFTSQTAKERLLKDILGDDMKDNETGRVYKDASAPEIIAYMKNSFFEIKSDCTDKKLLKIIAIRYNLYSNAYQKYVTTTIANEVSKKTVVAIQENKADLTGVSIEEKSIRKYNDSKYFAPILGYTGTISEEEMNKQNSKGNDYINSDIVGKAGIEYTMESELKGSRGEKKIFTDSTGKILSTISKTDPTAGNDVYLSLDSKQQIAAYKLLEKKIASILISELVNYDLDESKETDDDIHLIPIKRVYSQLIRNNVVSLKGLKKKRTANEKAVYSVYKDSLKVATKKMVKQLDSDSGVVYNELNDEFKEYYDYIYTLLKNDGILLTSTIDTEDKPYNKYVDGKISMNSFIKYEIKSNWISLDNLGVANDYLSSEETYDAIKKYIENDMRKNTTFAKIVMHYRIYDGSLSGSRVCMLLYDQHILKMDKEQYSLLNNFDSSATYRFIVKQIKKLNITPAQIALDPCSGSVIMTDPKSGKVKVMVTYPSYDNNKLSGSVDPEYWEKLTEDMSDPLYNRATMGATAPGSTFKMCTAMTALEYDIISTSESINCKGKYETVKPSPKCWIYPSAHGSLAVSGAIAQSCNYFFYEMGWRLAHYGVKTYDSQTGLGHMEKYATKLGLNMKSGVEITEKAPHFSTENAISSAIGQGSHAYAPIQISRYLNTLANGGKNYNLSLINKVNSSNGKLVYKKKSKMKNKIDADASTWSAIHSGMRKVVTGGTVEKFFTDTKIAIAGKSGTAQENKHRNSHSLFIAYAPYNNPKVAVTAVIPFGNSSHDSAELAKNVIQYYYGEIKDKDINKEVKKEKADRVTLD